MKRTVRNGHYRIWSLLGLSLPVILLGLYLTRQQPPEAVAIPLDEKARETQETSAQDSNPS
ncbi:hypothetical protein [Kiloniella sp. b19]|uniref:hypothetical protein n=1 Tax=Kiloniella sp. GXU_MW_B19 TaxID=3141326 RepID=UPI0031E2E540